MLRNTDSQETLEFKLQEVESKAVLRTFLFGPKNQFRCIAGKREGVPFFVVPAEFAIAFELHVNNMIHSKLGRGELVEIKNPYRTGKNHFYELRKVSKH